MALTIWKGKAWELLSLILTRGDAGCQNQGGEMFDALIFSTVNALEFNEVRQDVIRIPEVIGRVREAQDIWDARAPMSLDLVNFIGSDDRTFLSNLRLKNLATAVIQM